MNQRVFLRELAFASVAGLFVPQFVRASTLDEKLPPIRPITRGPKFHWFAYYDKLQFSPDNRFVLSNEVDFEGRSPRGDDVIRIGMVDLKDGDRWTELGSSHSWNWQQGCMLQWLPGNKSEIIWNDRDGDRFVARIMNVKTGKSRTLPAPIYALSPDGKWAVAPDFRRLNDCRPGYGYAGLVDPNRDIPAPEDAGIWRMNLTTGKVELLFSFAEALKIPFTGKVEKAFKPGAKHWFNHLLYNTNGTRFFFLHRWRNPDQSPNTFNTRAFTCDPDGKNWFCMDPHGGTSHFVWRDANHVMAWAWHPSHGERFYLYKDRTEQVEVVGLNQMTVNGHNTYLPGKGNQWILNDTYPDREGVQHPFLYHIPTQRKLPLAHLPSPPAYRGEWRCDTHPRSSRDGKWVCVDSSHKDGRQMYLIDIRNFI